MTGPATVRTLVTVNSAPPAYRPDPMYPGLPDAPATPPREHRPDARKPRPWLVMAPVLAAVLGFGLTAGLITVDRPRRVAAPVPTPARSPVNLLVATGAGTHETRAFISGRDWTLRYTFECAGRGGFTVVEDRNTTVVASREDKGAGVIARHGDPGTHVLDVSSTCTWTLTAIG